MKNKSNTCIDFKFKNPYSGETEEFSYYLDYDDVIKLIYLYGDAYSVNLDGKESDVFNMFMNLDSGRYEHIDEVLEKMLENEYVKEHLSEELSEKAHEEFLEEVEEEYESRTSDEEE